VSGSGISWAICKSAPGSRQITTPARHHSSFLQAGCPSCRPTNSVKALKHWVTFYIHSLYTYSTVIAGWLASAPRDELKKQWNSGVTLGLLALGAAEAMKCDPPPLGGAPPCAPSASSSAPLCPRVFTPLDGNAYPSIYTVSQKSERPKHSATAAANLHRFKWNFTHKRRHLFLSSTSNFIRIPYSVYEMFNSF